MADRRTTTAAPVLEVDRPRNPMPLPEPLRIAQIESLGDIERLKQASHAEGFEPAPSEVNEAANIIRTWWKKRPRTKTRKRRRNGAASRPGRSAG
jgi:hypothetical protein